MDRAIDESRRSLPFMPTRPPWKTGSGKFPRWAPVSMLILPATQELHMHTLLVEADLRMAKIAIEAHRNGVDAALRMAAPVTDPFDGKPIRTRVEGDVLRIWSVGPDGIDQGGSRAAPSPHGSGYGSNTDDEFWLVRLL